jgi:hypothetical protein
MPYSITTKDGITINGIPDELPHDDPSLKQRVAAIRAQGGPGAPATPAGPAPVPTPKLPEGSAPSSGVLMGLRDPIDAGVQLFEHVVPDGVSVALNKSTNWLADRLPSVFSHVAETPDGASRLVQEVNKQYDQGRVQRAQGLSNLVTGQQADPGFDWGRLAGNVVNPANLALPGGGSASTVRGLIAAGARTGAAAAAMQPVLNDDNGQNFWAKKAEQVGVGALTGGVITPAVSRGVEALAGGAQRAAGAVASRISRPSVTPGNVQQAVADALQSQGMRLEDAPQVILDSVSRQAQDALRSGQRLDAAAAIRRAEFEAVGLTGEAGPTLGQIQRDPMQYANERNLVGVRIRTPQGEGNPLSDRFQNQANVMQGVFDRAGATGATDANAAASTIMGGLRQADAPVQQGVTDLYTAARGMNNGRAAELERGMFSQAANRALDEGMLGHALPADVRNLLNDITAGNTPFNVDAATQIDTILSRAQRRVQSGQQPDLSAAAAIGRVRDALHATPLVGEAGAARGAAGGVEDAVMAQSGAPQLAGPAADRTLPIAGGAQPGTAVGQLLPQAGQAAAGLADNGSNARAAFDQARRAARDRFATIEATPALRAALDEAAPDKFVQQFILNAPARDVASMRTVLQNSPEALQQARAQIADHLKRAAFGNNASGDGGFAADRYLNTLRSLGREKLSVFFSPEEIVQFNLAGKVMSDITSIPAGARGAVNTSGTAGALMNLFSRFTSNTPVVRAIANQVGEIQTNRAMNRALAGQATAANPGAQLSPEAQRAIRLLFAPTAVAGGALSGQAAN